MEIRAQHVFITGAAKRIGHHLAKRFAGWGAKITAHARESVGEVESLVSQLTQQGVPAQSVLFDLSDVAAIERGVASAVAKLGPIGILINSASLFHPTPTENASEQDWDLFLDVNLKGQFFVARAAAREMVKRGGVILNLVDTNADRAMPSYAPYLASKAALANLTRNLAKEWAPNIRVNSLSPGWVLSPEGCPAEQVERNVAMTLLGRMGTPEDIAQAARFLVENDYITGLNLRVDGGRSL